MSTALSVSHVSYRYPLSRREVLTDVDVSIEAGMVAGLFGRNGAGKTTLLYLSAGLARPRSGTVRVHGRNPFSDATGLKSVVLMSSGSCLNRSTRLDKLGLYWARQRPNFDTDRLAELLDRFEVRADRKENMLSRGERSSANAAFAFACRAPLTILDEIHLGMDPVIRRRYYDTLLEEFIATGGTYIISSHQIEDVEHLISHAVVMDRGRVVRVGDADALRAALPGARSLTDVLMDVSGAEAS
ncbi:ABC-2 type transport system ATP-binding protein [Bowdeniella nasicola]|uniref:ABC-2 type transport system ATP-binding protein n=1 Tax=Bowdeniella nasicola TaxID=208480 RepID=A0A1H4CWI7_9ACTO|nr:ATP-binding cassette domain-containing protein [Bowdeniella nasicola]SEA64747.1 ABC-2 type transport system ATP-binding protein [Bowdeniella nasicola]